MRTPHLIAAPHRAGDRGAGYRHAELAVWDELQASREVFSSRWLSPEEGAMVLAEELDELWDEIRGNRVGLARAEAAQAGAMALRFIADLYESADSARDRDRRAADAAGVARGAVGPQGRVLASTHEGFGFMRREFDALWSAIRFDDPPRLCAVRFAAVSVRFIAEISSAVSMSAAS